MAVAATLEQSPYELAEFNPPMPEVLVVPEMLADEDTRYRAARFIGAAVLGSSEMVEVCATSHPIESLHVAIKRAESGDREALKLIETNVRTDVIERTIKTGHVMSKVPLVINSEGKIMQYGQTMDSIQANSLRFAADHPVMRKRTEAETRNAFRIEELSREGFFEDYSFVVISRAENLPEAGFFTETMSCSIQVTAKHGNGLATESAFVSGIAAPGEGQHDIDTIVKLGFAFGVDLRGKSAAEIIDTPLLVHNDLLPGGVIDIVKLYDESAGDTFFGEHRGRTDYYEYLDQCRNRERTFAPKVQQITAELIAEANIINSPMEAVERLHKLSEKHMLEKALTDNSIDLRVFGATAAMHLENARWYIEQGYEDQAAQSFEKAELSAKSSSCPSGRMNSDEPLTESKNDNKGDNDDCEFMSKQCPLCGQKNVKTRVRKLSLSGLKQISGSCGCSKIA